MGKGFSERKPEQIRRFLPSAECASPQRPKRTETAEARITLGVAASSAQENAISGEWRDADAASLVA